MIYAAIAFAILLGIGLLGSPTQTSERTDPAASGVRHVPVKRVDTVGKSRAQIMREVDVAQSMSVAKELSFEYSAARAVADAEFIVATAARDRARDVWLASGCDDAHLDALQQAYADYNNAHAALDRAIDDDLSAFERVMNIRALA